MSSNTSKRTLREIASEAQGLLRWRYGVDDAGSLPQGQALLAALSSVPDPDMVPPNDMSQALEAALSDLRQLKIEEEEDEAREREAEQRKRRQLLDEISSSFFPLVKDTSMPTQLQICIRCRVSGHSLEGCSILSGAESCDNPIQVLRKAYRAQYRQGLTLPHTKPPKLVQLRTGSSESWLEPCKTCQSLPILDLLSSQEYGGDIAYSTIGWITDLRFRQDCPVCITLVNSLPDEIKRKEGYALLFSRPSLLRYIPDVKSLPERPPRSLCLLVNSDVDITLGSWLSEGVGRVADSPDAIQTVLLSEDSKKEHKAFQALPFGDEVMDYSMVNEWLRRCDMFHPQTCNNNPTPSDIDAIRLIDVTCRKLTSYVDAGRPDYLVLSYVWGNVPTPAYPGTSVIGSLPRTLEDAIELTIKLGKRYIWIDAICINQASEEDKRKQIRLMDSIYTAAWLTIVSLSGTSMNAGIPRVTEKATQPSQMRCNFDGVPLVSTGLTLGQQLGRSRWTTRAWTFQEAVLSRRCLYVAEDQVYFQCNGAPASSESIDDFDSPVHAYGGSGVIDAINRYSYIHFRNPFLGDSGESVSPLSMEWVDGPSEYQYLLCEYSRRQMTHDTDSVNAFNGVLHQLEKRYYHEGFFQGIPIQDLDKCLVWGHSGARRRRAGFPAWSWAGWEGELEVTYFDTVGSSTNRDWQKPHFKASRSVGKRLRTIFLSEPSQRAEKAFDYGTGPDGSYSFDRQSLPHDPFWDLAVASSDDLAYSEQLLQSGEDDGVLFIDCITIQLDVQAEQFSSVKLQGVMCDIQWYGEGTKQMIKTKQLSLSRDFVVLSRPVSHTLNVLMVDIKGQTATRTAAAKVRIPDKGVLDRMAAIGSHTAHSRFGAELSAMVDNLESASGGGISRDSMADDEFHGRLIAEGAFPKRRHLMLV